VHIEKGAACGGIFDKRRDRIENIEHLLPKSPLGDVTLDVNAEQHRA
jgi:hypothetical protein